MSFISELQRRNVIRVAAGYLAASWLLIQIIETLSSMFELSAVAGQVVVLLLGIGFIPVVILTWVFEWTPTGLVRDREGVAEGTALRHRRFDRIVIVILVLAVTYFSIDKFVLDPARDTARERDVASQARTEALVQSYGDKSIVVLPFVNMSNSADDEYFSDGITEELLNLLADIRELRVISRTSSFAFKNMAIRATEVSDQLNVSYVLEGSVRKAGNTVRITAQLIDGRSDTHLWSETYDREFELSDVLEVQDEIARLVVNELRVSFLEHDVHSVNPVAYEANLQVQYLLNLYDRDNVDEIEALIARGLAAEPGHVDLLWGKHRLITHKLHWQLMSKEEADIAKARIGDQLRQLDPDNVRWLFVDAWPIEDVEKTARLISKAYNRAPTDPYVVETAARYARALGQFDVAIALGEFLVSRDPLCGRCFWRLGLTYHEAMRFEEATEPFEKSILLGTGGLDPNEAMGFNYLAMGKPELALPAFANTREERRRILGTILAHYDLGDTEQYERLSTTFLASADWDLIAWHAAWTGDADTAFEYVEKLYAEYPTSEYWRTLFSDALFMRVRDDPRWDELMQRLGTTEADFAKVTLDIQLLQ